MSSKGTHLQGLYRISQVIYRTCGGSEMENKIKPSLHEDIVGYVMVDEREIFPAGKMCDIVSCSGEEVVHGQNFVPVRKKPFAKVTAYEPCTSGYKDPHSLSLEFANLS